MMRNMNDIVGQYNICMIVLDTLRYDVADELLKAGKTPVIASHLKNGWVKSHSPGSFTFPAHQAFFAGFLPTPAKPGNHERLFAAAFSGSETSSENTAIFENDNIVAGLAAKGYHTVCMGGVGFFNKKTALGSVLPGYFKESWWDETYGVTDKNSPENQIAFLRQQYKDFQQNLFLYINIAALHQPNYFYLENSKGNEKIDNLDTHRAAMEYVDSQMEHLFDFLRSLRQTFIIICSDHGTAYGEDGFYGHRIGHEQVYTVPYADFILD